MLIMAYSGKYMLEKLYGASIELLWALILSIIGAMCVYLFSLIMLKMIGKQDVERIPYIGKGIAPLFPKR